MTSCPMYIKPSARLLLVFSDSIIIIGQTQQWGSVDNRSVRIVPSLFYMMNHKKCLHLHLLSPSKKSNSRQIGSTARSTFPFVLPKAFEWKGQKSVGPSEGARRRRPLAVAGRKIWPRRENVTSASAPLPFFGK